MRPPPNPEPITRIGRDERRASLLNAAMEAFSEGGYHSTAMDDIAERAGVSKPVLYRHFDSKLDLYLAVAHRVAAEVVRITEDALSSTDVNEDRMKACLTNFFAFVERPSSGYALLFASDMLAEPAVASLLEDTRQACGEAMGRAMAEEMGLPWEECVLLGSTMVAIAQDAALHWYRRQHTLSRERVLALITTVTWTGLVSVPPGVGSAASEG